MLQASVLGLGLSPGELLAARSHEFDPLSPGPSRLPRHTWARDVDCDEQLTWTSTEVTWSRGVELIRRFKFPQDNQQILYALFAQFRAPGDDGEPTNDDPPKRVNDDTFGPFHTSQTAMWEEQAAGEWPRRGVMRCVVILRERTAHIYFPTGEDVVAQLPFRFQACWALDRGLLLQRELERREVRKSIRSVLPPAPGASILDTLAEVEESSPDIPRLYTLLDVMSEMQYVADGRVNGVGDKAKLVPTAPLAFVPPTQNVLFVSEDPYPFVVTYDTADDTIVFYRRAKVPVEDEELPTPTTTARHLHPEELLAQNQMSPRRLSDTASRPRRSGRISLPRDPQAERRLSEAAPDPLDRTHRRSSRFSIGSDFPVLATEPPTFSLANGERPSRRPRNSNASERSRRVSSKPADFSEFAKTALHVVAEDLRETTMLMGLDEEAKRSDRSEIVFDRIWSWKPSTPIDHTTARVFISENLSPESVFLNLVLSSDGSTTLFTFHVELRSERYIFTEVQATACLSAAPVKSTRPGLCDSLVLTLEGDLVIESCGLSVRIPVDVPNVVPTDGRDEVARKLAISLSMVRDAGGSKNPTIIDLIDAVDSRVTAVYSDGDRARISLDFTLPCGLTRRCLEALVYALPHDEFAEFLHDFLLSLQGRRSTPETQWDAFASVLCSKCGLGSSAEKKDILFSPSISGDSVLSRLAERLRLPPEGTPSSAPVSPVPSAEQVLLLLHIVAQDCRLASTTEADMLSLAPLLMRFAAGLGRADWLDYWKRLVPAAMERTTLAPPASPVTTPTLDQLGQPLDILLYLARVADGTAQPFVMPILADTQALGKPDPWRQTELVGEIYQALSPKAGVTVEERAYSTVAAMMERKLSAAWLADLPFGVAMPIMEMIRVVQANPSMDHPPAYYAFINRPDLAAIYDYERGSTGLPVGPEATSDSMPTVGDIVNNTGDWKAVAFTALPHVRFGLDRRLDEVERIMQTTRLRTIALDDPKGVTEAEVLQYHQQVVNTLAHRTLAVTVGQGMFMYGSRSTAITDTWTVQPIELTVKVLPRKEVIKAQLANDGVDWPCFHNGVSAALAFSPDCEGITASWIMSNRPKVLTSEHGGFLLGLGLKGHLRTFGSVHALTYLEPRHDFTSIGLLLGLGASFAGSTDTMVTKMLSLHTHALLPLGSMDLNQSALVQSAALVSLGLVYAGKKNHRMAEVTLNEIGRDEMPGVDGFSEYKETYSFSAAMAFGLINLGKGGQSSSETERQFLAKLMPCIHGEAPSIDGLPEKRKHRYIDSTVTSPGATLALGLMYLRTGRKDIADILDVPQTPIALESVRPEQLLIRTFARSLIMWNDVRGTMDWVDEQLPAFIHALHHKHKRTSGMELNTELAYLNIVAGACLGIGLRYASTANEAAHSVILTFFGVLGKAAAGQSMTYEGRIRRNAARQALNIVTLALAVLMSGTGELGVLRRLRVSHGQEGAGVTYGSHMAMHMALGLLFLGRGYYTLGNSNLAIAAMAISFFPRFLPGPSDNKAYPQAFRHLWALAVEPRCLIARDVDTRESIFLPIKVKTRGHEGDQSLISPTLVAPFETIESILVDSPRYWPVQLNLDNKYHRASLVQTRTIWVKRKAGFLDYSEDPRGYRSMFVRAGTMSGFDLHYDLLSPAAPLQPPVSEIVSVIEAHADNPVYISMAQQFSGETNFESFLRLVLLECISLDKPEIINTYLSMVLAKPGPLSVEHLTQLGFLTRFYSSALFDKYTTERRHPLLRQPFIQALERKFAMKDVGGQHRPGRDSSVRNYFLGKPVQPVAAQSLAIQLLRQKVPPLQLLEALRARASTANTTLEVLELRTRAVVEAFLKATPPWLGEPAQAPSCPESQVWALDSMRQALGAWTSAEL